MPPIELHPSPPQTLSTSSPSASPDPGQNEEEEETQAHTKLQHCEPDESDDNLMDEDEISNNLSIEKWFERIIAAFDETTGSLDLCIFFHYMLSY